MPHLFLKESPSKLTYETQHNANHYFKPKDLDFNILAIGWGKMERGFEYILKWFCNIYMAKNNLK